MLIACPILWFNQLYREPPSLCFIGLTDDYVRQ